MSEQLFRYSEGTDGLRGSYGTAPIDEASFARLGQAAAGYAGGGVLLLGHDPRASSPALADAFMRGANERGADVVNLGVAPTPAVSWMLGKRGIYTGGAVITASHNPPGDNGGKLFNPDGSKLSEAEARRVDGFIIAPGERRGGRGRVTAATLEDYQRSLVDDIWLGAGRRPFDGMRLVVDAANGAFSRLAAPVLRELGATVISMADKPDGNNINEGCGATSPEAMAKRVVDEGADAGIALDGDGDRGFLADETGELLDGDKIAYLLAVTRGERQVAGTIMSNLGYEVALRDAGDIGLIRTDVGDKYVAAAMREHGLSVGAEQSGHVILWEYAPTGDGMRAAIEALARVRASDRPLSGWRNAWQAFPQRLVNIRVPGSVINNQAVQARLRNANQRLGEKGRAFVRASGTEPVVRLTVEARDESQVDRYARELAALIEIVGTR